MRALMAHGYMPPQEGGGAASKENRQRINAA